MFARKNSYSRKIVYFGCWCFFYAQNFFVKKKKKDKNGIDMIVTITSFAILLMCIPINPPIENLFSHVYVHDKSAGFFYIIICQNLYASISTCVSYCQDSSVRICMNVQTSKVLIFFLLKTLRHE